jgi:hypothetical protein
MDCLKDIEGVGTKVIKDVYGQEWTLSEIEDFEISETGEYRGALVFNNSNGDRRTVEVIMAGDISEEECRHARSRIEVEMGNLLDKTNPARLFKTRDSFALIVPPGPVISRTIDAN